MALNKYKAKRYNNNRGYEARVIRLIQSLVGAPIHGSFDNTTVQAIYDWQGSSQRMTTLAQDGMFGPNSAGCAIAEFRRADKHLEASVLAPYPHNLPSGFTDPDDNPVKKFRHKTLTNLDLRRPPSGEGMEGWFMRGCFEVTFELKDDIADPSRYEYRQLIRGKAGVTDGFFQGENDTNWQQLSPEVPANKAFRMPGGLPQTFKEDVHEHNGQRERFGYRSSVAINKPSSDPGTGMKAGLIDRYLPGQSDGYSYECRDTFGMGSNRPSVIGTRVRLQLDYFGYIYDKLLAKAVKQLSWSYNETKFVTTKFMDKNF